MKIKLTFILLISLSFTALSQDVENLSISDAMGSSRTLGLAGAQSVLGSDVGSIYHNPASMGLFRRSEISLTPSFGATQINSSYFNTESKVGSPFSNLNNLGFAFATTDDTKEKGFKSYTIGLTYNRIASFNSLSEISIENPDHSFTTYLGEFVTDDVAKNPENLNIKKVIDEPSNISEIAWKSYLIDTKDDSTFYGVANKGGVGQKLRFENEGYHTSWNIGVGTNYEDFLYLGGSLDINQYEFISQMSLIETDIEDTIESFNRFEYNHNYASSGNGFGFSLGAIVKPIEYWRIGVSYKSGITYNLRTFTDFGFNDVDLSDSNEIKLLKSYELLGNEETIEIKTASRLTIGNYIQVMKYGFFTTDFEYRFTSKLDNSGNYKDFYKLSFGGEYRKGIIRLRAGYGFQNSMFIDALSNSFWAIGGGVRKGPFFVDIALNKFGNSSIREIYSLSEYNNDINFNLDKFVFSFTTGVKF